MTKIRNTKKGMAKKTLSISLAVAMLATSNVPVWAAEDLFTDGEVAVEAFTSEEEVEAPVVEEEVPVVTDAVEEEAPVAQDNAPTWDSRYEVEYKVPASMTWNETKNVEFRVYDNIAKAYVTKDGGFHARLLNGDFGQLDGVYGGDQEIHLPAENDGYAYVDFNFAPWVKDEPSFVGKTLRFQIYNYNDKNEVGYAQASSPFEVTKVAVNGTVNLTGNPDWISKWDAVEYTGKPITEGPTLVEGIKLSDYGTTANKNGIVFDGVVKNYKLTGSLDYKKCLVRGDDVVNAKNLSGKDLTATVAIDDPLYAGNVVMTFAIEPKELTNANFTENISITLPETTYEYTGSRITVPNEKAIVTDLNSGVTYANSLAKNDVIWVSDAKGSVGEYVSNANGQLCAWLGNASLTEAKILLNYTYWKLNPTLVPVVGEYNVVARDLANAANTAIYIKNIPYESLTAPDKVSADVVRKNLVIKDVKTDKDITSGIMKKAKFSLEADPLKVVTGGEYTATVETTDTTCVTNKRDITFKVIGHDLQDARADKQGDLQKSAVYTGSQITKNITKDNFDEKFGFIRDQKKQNEWDPLIKDVQYSSTPRFGENTNVGKGQIIIDGLQDYAGTEKVIEFAITAREATDLNVPTSVPYDEACETAADYKLADQTTVTASFKDEWTGEKKTLTVPASDYTITYAYLDENKAVVNGPVKGGYIRTTVALKSTVKSNFTFADANGDGKKLVATADTKLVKKVITAENVILNKDSYVYTGKDVALDYKVVYNGETLVKGTDFDIVIRNGKNAGTGTLIVKGMGEFDETPVSVDFTIAPAKTTDVKVTHDAACVYNGRKHEHPQSEMKLELNGVDVSGDFKISYPTSKYANINAGNGDIILTPVKNTSNTFNFDAKETVNFVIGQATLTGGTLKAYNEKESLVVWREDAVNGMPAAEFRFAYDGFEKSYTKTTFEAAAQGEDRVVTANDWEIKYVDAVSGKEIGGADGEFGVGHALVIAKGNYKGGKTYECADGTKISNVVEDKEFLIEKREIHRSNVTVANGQYRGGKEVAPVVTINYNGKELVQGKDFAIDFSKYPNQNRKDVTNGKTLDVTLVAKGGYYFAGDPNEEFQWGIDAFDLKNAEIIVKGTDANPYVKVLNGTVVVDPDEYDLTIANGKVTVTAKKTSINYVGTQTTDIKEALEKPGKAMIDRVDFTGNKATVVLTGEVEGAIGYDYVISPNRNCIVDKDYTKVNKNKLTTDTTFQYVEQGMYYAYCHAWTRDENGKKVFGEWSEAYPFSISAITPGQPTIESVKQKGSTVTVTYTATKDAEGYDVVLGSAMATINDEKRPVKYGTLVKKNATTTTVTFKNVPEGRYYVGLHAFNRTSEDGKKVFSPWSVAERFDVK